jgi:hypothetical protein
LNTAVEDEKARVLRQESSQTQAQSDLLSLLNKVEKDSLNTVNNSMRPAFSFFKAGQSPLLVKLALGNLMIVGDEIDYLQRVQIQANAAPAPASVPLTASPATLGFSSQNGATLGTPQAITLTNSGSSPLTSLAPSIANTTDFSIQSNSSNPCSSTLAAAGTCQVFVAFTPSVNPSSASSRTATLQVSFSPGSSPLAIGLSGSASSTVYFSTSALALGTATAAAPSTAKLTIINFESTGLTNLAFPIVSPATGTAAGDFTVSSNTCGAAAAVAAIPAVGATPAVPATPAIDGTLAGNGGSCTFAVKFAPTAGSAARAATLTVNYKLGGAAVAQVVKLSGTNQ